MVTLAQWPQAPPAPQQIFAPFSSHRKTRSWPPYKRPVSPDQASLRLALARRHQAGQAQKEQAEHTGPAETDSPRERSAGVREAFHRERGGEPKASSTRRRACTGGQRQSYKRVGYLTRSSGWVSQGQAGTATEPRSSSWRDPRRFLEGKEEAAAARSPLRTTTTASTAKQLACTHPGTQGNRRHGSCSWINCSSLLPVCVLGPSNVSAITNFGPVHLLIHVLLPSPSSPHLTSRVPCHSNLSLEKHGEGDKSCHPYQDLFHSVLCRRE